MFEVTQTRISLSAVDVAPPGSREVLCYEATVLLDGRPIAHARNDGHGLMTYLHPIMGAEGMMAEAEALAKTLPPVDTGWADPLDPTRTQLLPISLSLVADLLASTAHQDSQVRDQFCAEAIWIRFAPPGESGLSGGKDACLAHRLAETFIDLVRDHLTVGDLTELRIRNLPYQNSRDCSSRDYVDADDLMAVAFSAVVGRPPDDPLIGSDCELVTHAWQLAKEAHFTRFLRLIRKPPGTEAYAYCIRGETIEDPYRSPDGLVRVEPGQQHRLIPEEVAALVEANAKLSIPQQAEATKALAASAGAITYEKMTLSEVCSRYPKLEIWPTGGGCSALRLDLQGDTYVLITDSDGARIPEASATEVAVGRYTANGNLWGKEETLPVEAIPTWIDRTVARVCKPDNVGDYFVVRLGEDPQDDSLYSVLLNSACGTSCRQAIDSCATVIHHLQETLGRDGQLIPRARSIQRTPESYLIAIARLLVRLYWRG